MNSVEIDFGRNFQPCSSYSYFVESTSFGTFILKIRWLSLHCCQHQQELPKAIASLLLVMKLDTVFLQLLLGSFKTRRSYYTILRDKTGWLWNKLTVIESDFDQILGHRKGVYLIGCTIKGRDKLSLATCIKNQNFFFYNLLLPMAFCTHGLVKKPELKLNNLFNQANPSP